MTQTPMSDPMDDEPGVFTSGWEPPAYMFRKLPPLRPHFNDPISRRLAGLFQLHESVDKQHAAVDLRRLTPMERRALLAEVERTLGIKPIRTRRLGYVGPADDAVRKREFRARGSIDPR